MPGESVDSEIGPSSVLLLNGPNLNLLGDRDPSVYGHATLKDVERRAVELGLELGVAVRCVQTNSESAIIDLLHDSRKELGVVINPGAYGHYSYAIRDAIEVIEIPVIEVHISNIHAREAFRHVSVITPVVSGFISGIGIFGYELALRALVELIRGHRE